MDIVCARNSSSSFSSVAPFIASSTGTSRFTASLWPACEVVSVPLKMAPNTAVERLASAEVTAMHAQFLL